MPDSHPVGFLAVPAAGEGRPVLVLHAWWGLNETMKGFCSRLAESGFAAFAPDMFQGKIAANPADAEALMMEFEGEASTAAVRAGAGFLTERFDKSGRGIAVIGLSYGAYYALELSAVDAERIRSVVIFYGTGHDEFSRSRASYQCHFAENDEFEPQENIDDLEAALSRAERPVEIHRYPGTGHWFFEPDVTHAYNESAAELAWDRTVSFLRANA
jgi:carboxymethylenebutenolidase